MNRTKLLLPAALCVFAIARAIPAGCQAPEWSALLEGIHTDGATSLCQGDGGSLYMTGRISDGTFAGTPGNSRRQARFSRDVPRALSGCGSDGR